MGNIHCKDQRKAVPDEFTAEEKCILALVEAHMKAVDCEFIPNAVEKRMYINLVKFVLASTKNVLDDIRVEFLGHVITIHIDPISENVDTSA